jgi:hypothetical protein
MALTLKADVGFDVTSSKSNAKLTCLSVDYNSWVESDKGRRLANSLDKDVVLAEG